jgi:hypothetical protein
LHHLFAHFRADAHDGMMGQTVMVIDGADPGPWFAAPDEGSVLIVPYANLTLAVLKDHLPDSIVLPLFGPDFDAMDALVRLCHFGFSGPVIVTSPALPNPDAIARELAAAAPGIAVQLQISGQDGLSR